MPATIDIVPKQRKIRYSRKSFRRDSVAGLVLGIESVPDGLAAGVLAGVNPLAGLYGYLFGMVGAAFFTSSAFMAVQATGAMALLVADADLQSFDDANRALFTLSILTGLVMILAGALRLGRLIRFVPTAVMTGFITAVGVSIVLGQLPNLTGTEAQGANRIVKTLDLVAHLLEWSWPSLAIGLVTIVLILWLQRTRIGPLGLVIAIVVGTLLALALNTWTSFGNIAIVSDSVDVPQGLPAPVLPDIGAIANLLLPAVSLAFVGLVQGAGVSAGIPTPDGKPANASRDFVGQGAGNILSGLFQGMPVGGSMSASSLVVAGGAKTRGALFIAGITMMVVILAASQLVGYIAMPALAGLLIVVGAQSVKPSRVFSAARSGILPASIMTVTFVLTLIIPLQYAVLVGVGLGIVLFAAQQSNLVRVREAHLDLATGRIRETDPPQTIPADTVTILQPYGSLFFASAPKVEAELPEITATSTNAVVVLRLRGTEQIGLALVDVLRRYEHQLNAQGGILKIVASEERVLERLETSGLADDLGRTHIYRGKEWVGDALADAVRDGQREIREG